MSIDRIGALTAVSTALVGAALLSGALPMANADDPLFPRHHPTGNEDD